MRAVCKFQDEEESIPGGTPAAGGGAANVKPGPCAAQLVNEQT